MSAFTFKLVMSVPSKKSNCQVVKSVSAGLKLWLNASIRTLFFYFFSIFDILPGGDLNLCRGHTSNNLPMDC